MFKMGALFTLRYQKISPLSGSDALAWKWQYKEANLLDGWKRLEGIPNVGEVTDLNNEFNRLDLDTEKLLNYDSERATLI